MLFCPACKCGHWFNDTWKFNGDTEKPTIDPSLLVTGCDNDGKEMKCHSFVKEGKIQFLSDCSHDMKGKIVELKDF